jgi:Domain of unknown function (DUF4336)
MPMAELCEFAHDVWTLEGPPVRFVGMLFPTRMIIVKLANGVLWINSPVSVSRDTLERIRALGPVKYLVAPNNYHLWRLGEWHALLPNAELWASPRASGKLKRLPFAGVLGNTPPQIWANDLDQFIFLGNPFIAEVLFLHKKSRTVILADLIQNHRLEKGRPLVNVLLRLDGLAYPNGGVPRDMRLTFTNRKLACQSLEKLLSWDFDKLIIGHGVCIEKDAKPFVEHAFRWLRK